MTYKVNVRYGSFLMILLLLPKDLQHCTMQLFFYVLHLEKVTCFNGSVVGSD